MISIRAVGGVLVAVAFGVQAAASPLEAPSETLFSVRTTVTGLDYVNVSGGDGQGPIIEQNGQGVALLDFDGDGWLDVFVTNGGTLERWRAGEGESARAA